MDIKKPLSPEQAAAQKHYTQHMIQVMEFCECNKLGWCASNVVKYVCRENAKNGIEDLNKALTYLACLIVWKESGIWHNANELEITIKPKEK